MPDQTQKDRVMGDSPWVVPEIPITADDLQSAAMRGDAWNEWLELFKPVKVTGPIDDPLGMVCSSDERELAR
jgi:hypothetical protein